MTKRSGANKNNLEQTHQLFLDLGQQEFKKHGYANASTSRIVTASGMARGSLYYHFKDKQDLFRAVYKNMMQETADRLSKNLDGDKDPDIALLDLAKDYFRLCADPIMGRLLMIEPLTVLGPEECHRITSDTIRPVLLSAVERIINLGGFKGHNKAMMTMFIFSSLTESGRIISTLPNRAIAEEQFFQTFQWALERLL